MTVAPDEGELLRGYRAATPEVREVMLEAARRAVKRRVRVLGVAWRAGANSNSSAVKKDSRMRVVSMAVCLVFRLVPTLERGNE